MNDTDQARTAAAHLTTALDHLHRAQTAIRDAQTAYPDKEAGDDVYGHVLTNMAAMIGYVQLLRVPAQTYAGDVAGLKAGVRREHWAVLPRRAGRHHDLLRPR